MKTTDKYLILHRTKRKSNFYKKSYYFSLILNKLDSKLAEKPDFMNSTIYILSVQLLQICAFIY